MQASTKEVEEARRAMEETEVTLAQAREALSNAEERGSSLDDQVSSLAEAEREAREALERTQAELDDAEQKAAARAAELEEVESLVAQSAEGLEEAERKLAEERKQREALLQALVESENEARMIRERWEGGHEPGGRETQVRTYRVDEQLTEAEASDELESQLGEAREERIRAREDRQERTRTLESSEATPESPVVAQPPPARPGGGPLSRLRSALGGGDSADDMPSCVVCQREPDTDDPSTLTREGWLVRDGTKLCTECQSDGWRLRPDTAFPYRRLSDRP
jgi:chromosome segregation ATPase